MRLSLYYLKKGIKSFFMNPFLNFLTVGILTISFLLLITFIFFYYNISGVIDKWGKEVQISLFFQIDVPEDRILEIKETIEKEKEVKKVHYTSRDKALEYLEGSIEGVDQVITILDENPLPASLDISLKKNFQDPSSIEGFVKRMKFPEVSYIDYTEEWVDRFRSFLNLLKLAGLVLGTMLVASGIFIIHNTIRLCLWTRREEISIMKLIGATRGFIRNPFLIEGALQGGAGAGFSVLILVLLHNFFISQIELSTSVSLSGIFVRFLPLNYIIAFIGAGVIMGITGSLFAINRFLKEEANGR